jgi:hypothetical protein
MNAIEEKFQMSDAENEFARTTLITEANHPAPPHRQNTGTL